jgi:multimeric flavodoxin WrbA
MDSIKQGGEMARQIDLEDLRKAIEEVETNILVITASHRRNGHSQFLGKEALSAASKVPGTNTAFIDLAERTIHRCRACEDRKTGNRRCIPLNEDGTPDFHFCPATRGKDDMIELWEKMLWADGMIIGCGVYAANVPGVLKDVFDRTVTALKTHKYWLGNKIGAAFAVAACTHGGQEQTIEAIEHFYRICGMIIATDGPPTEEEVKADLGERPVLPGKTPLVSQRAHWAGASAHQSRGSVKDDALGMSNVRGLGGYVARVAKWIKAGRGTPKLRKWY